MVPMGEKTTRKSARPPGVGTTPKGNGRTKTRETRKRQRSMIDDRHGHIRGGPGPHARSEKTSHHALCAESRKSDAGRGTNHCKTGKVKDQRDEQHNTNIRVTSGGTHPTPQRNRFEKPPNQSTESCVERLPIPWILFCHCSDWLLGVGTRHR